MKNKRQQVKCPRWWRMLMLSGLLLNAHTKRWRHFLYSVPRTLCTLGLSRLHRPSSLLEQPSLSVSLLKDRASSTTTTAAAAPGVTSHSRLRHAAANVLIHFSWVWFHRHAFSFSRPDRNCCAWNALALEENLCTLGQRAKHQPHLYSRLVSDRSRLLRGWGSDDEESVWDGH